MGQSLILVEKDGQERVITSSISSKTLMNRFKKTQKLKPSEILKFMV